MTSFKKIVLLAVLALCATSAIAIAATITGTEGPDVLVGTDGADIINTLGSDDNALGLSGDDIIDGGVGADILRGDWVCPPGATTQDVLHARRHRQRHHQRRRGP